MDNLLVVVYVVSMIYAGVLISTSGKFYSNMTNKVVNRQRVAREQLNKPALTAEQEQILNTWAYVFCILLVITPVVNTLLLYAAIKRKSENKTGVTK